LPVLKICGVLRDPKLVRLPLLAKILQIRSQILTQSSHFTTVRVGAKAGRKEQTSAVKRLLQDLKYMREHVVPTVGVVALPLEKVSYFLPRHTLPLSWWSQLTGRDTVQDLFTWHCNIRGPKGTLYEGGGTTLLLPC
jgi:hypothetical protein